VEAGCFLEKARGGGKNSKPGGFFSGGELLVQTHKNVENLSPRDAF